MPDTFPLPSFLRPLLLGALVLAPAGASAEAGGEDGGLRDEGAHDQEAEAGRGNGEASSEDDEEAYAGNETRAPPAAPSYGPNPNQAPPAESTEAPQSTEDPRAGGATGVLPRDPSSLEVDVWVESWWNRTIDIHKVLPDAERGRRVARMFYNFSVVAYASNDTPFRYAVYIDGAKATEGTATHRLYWVSSVVAETGNMTIVVEQAGKTKTAHYEHIIWVEGEDPGIGGEYGEAARQPRTRVVTEGYLTRLTWGIILGGLVQMVAAFTVVGALNLEKVQRMGWQRWVG